MRRLKTSLAICCLLLAIVFLPSCLYEETSYGPSTTESPNVLLITLDTLRADFLGIYGGPTGLTPRIDHFARASVVFDQAATTIGTTFPAHASIFTGLYPKAHRVRWNGDTLDPSFRTMAEILAQAGYETAAFVSLRSMLSRGAMNQGFAVTNSPRPETIGELVEDGEEINELAISLLANKSEDPFFLWLHYFEAHSPYRLTPYARERFAESGYSGVLAKGASTELFYSLGGKVPWSSEERQALQALYAGEVAQLDHLVGEILDELRAANLLNDTLVILTSDHGQALGEHDAVGHGFLLWQPVVHIPLIIGGLNGIQERRVSESRVSLVDLMPTILDLVGQPTADTLQGRSIAPALWGERLLPRPCFVEVRDLRDNRRWSQADASAIAVLQGPLKAIWRSDGLLWFDLERDPKESDPTAASIPRKKRSELLKLLEAYREDSATSSFDEPSQQTVDELRSLGYIQ